MSNLYENNNYEVVKDNEPETERECYGVRNKETGFIEARASVLPQALVWADEFSGELDRFHADKANSSIEVAPANDKEFKKPH